MPNTMTLISAITVGSGGASNINFTSIPSTYTDLVLKSSARTNRSNSYEDAVKITFNGSGGTAYSVKRLYGDGTSVAESVASGEPVILPYSTASNTVASGIFGNFEIYLPNYSSTSLYKTASIDMVSESNATDSIMGLSTGMWSSSSAINQITLAPNVGTLFLEYTTAYLYGIKNS